MYIHSYFCMLKRNEKMAIKMTKKMTKKNSKSVSSSQEQRNTKVIMFGSASKYVPCYDSQLLRCQKNTDNMEIFLSPGAVTPTYLLHPATLTPTLTLITPLSKPDLSLLKNIPGGLEVVRYHRGVAQRQLPDPQAGEP